MKEVILKQGMSSRSNFFTCSPFLNGCGRKLKKGEKVMRQAKGTNEHSVRYLCMNCWNKNTIEVEDDDKSTTS